MKLSLRLLFVSIACFFGLNSHAQNSLVIDYSNQIDSSYTYGDVIPFEGVVTYFGSGVYQGTLEIGVGTFNSGTFTADTLNFSQQIALQNQESSNFFVEIPVTASLFAEGGGHTVIVWPILSPNPPTLDIDSVFFQTEIVGDLNISEWANAKQAKIFPIPATDFVMLQKPDESPIAQIAIYDLKGNLVFSGQANETYMRIQLDGLSAGTYILRYSDGVKPTEAHRILKR